MQEPPGTEMLLEEIEMDDEMLLEEIEMDDEHLVFCNRHTRPTDAVSAQRGVDGTIGSNANITRRWSLAISVTTL